MKLSFLYWNINRKPRADMVSVLAREHDIDIIGLSECLIAPEDLLSYLNGAGGNLYHWAKNVGSAPIFLTRLPLDLVRSVWYDKGFSIWKISFANGEKLFVAIAHFFSKRFRDPADYLFKCNDLAHTIKQLEEDQGVCRTVIMGDFNMNPFEEGMIAADGLNAVMDKKVASRLTRTVAGAKRCFFYNPMWSLLGDLPSGPPGTYYYDTGTQVNYYWNTFDQVLIRPELIEEFIESELEIITSAGGRSLLTDSGIPDKVNASDHLPIKFRLELMKGDGHERRD